MNLAEFLPDLADVPESLLVDSIESSFLSWADSQGIELFPHQVDSLTAILSEANVIVSTPTGSGKSMVALAAHFQALALNRRSFYTAPIKALVNEKFFALCQTFGAQNVGLMTGDATVNGSAPIICATAEIVANIALREGADAQIDQVVMDEFHYYSDPQRGWAWQVPLLELPQAQFILMSATLGDTDRIVSDLSERTGRHTELISGAQRPVPLSFEYVYKPLIDIVQELLEENRAPIYVVHFAQADAISSATLLAGKISLSKESQQAIKDELKGFRFTSVFGRQLRTLLHQGIGVHHAGMLPKYRRIVEQLAQSGCLRVICGTDTLGVGINVPIRTVLMTGLAKFDGVKKRVLNSREFHQIAGRAGRAGYDTHGYVYVQAPEHEIENVKLRAKAAGDPKKLKKLRKKSLPEGQVGWTEKTFERLIDAEPEHLTSQFSVTNSMLLNVLSRPGDGFEHMRRLLRGNHETRRQQNGHIRHAIELYRGLVNAGIISETDTPDESGSRAHVTTDLPRDFALNQPLAPFAIAALEVLDPESKTYSLDILSVIEAILENPRVLLIAQQKKARGEEIAALKAEGVDFTDRKAIVEEITYPKPLEDLLETTYEAYCEGHPWAREFEPMPKSVVRDMVEHAMTFSDVISVYGLARAEGVVLRYLTDAWKTLMHTLPPDYRTEELDDIIDWLGEVVRQVDSSLLDEWALLADPDAALSDEQVAEVALSTPSAPDLTDNKRAFTRMVRNHFFRHVELFALEREKELAELDDYLENPPDWPAAMDDYFDEYADLGLDGDARGPQMILIDEGPEVWHVRQIIDDPDGDHGWAFEGDVDLAASNEAGEVRLASLEIISG